MDERSGLLIYRLMVAMIGPPESRKYITFSQHPELSAYGQLIRSKGISQFNPVVVSSDRPTVLMLLLSVP